ncbi:unnamed protein product, partial [Ectocarpus sp. 6 AP-2014]
ANLLAPKGATRRHVHMYCCRSFTADSPSVPGVSQLSISCETRRVRGFAVENNSRQHGPTLPHQIHFRHHVGAGSQARTSIAKAPPSQRGAEATKVISEADCSPLPRLCTRENCKEKAPFYTMPQTDRKALVALYNATSWAKWRNNRNWSNSAALSQWHGVEVNHQGRVVRLFLWDNDLQGPLPKELGALSKLQYLRLNNNNLTGPIPSELGHLSVLKRLNLSGNQLSGHIPKELGALSKLQWLELRNNKLTGNIPPELGDLRQLQTLYLNSNRLTGPIPKELGALSRLEMLWLNDNSLTGPIPSDLGHLSALKELDLSYNQLSGNIPPELGDLRQLQTLYLNSNRLTGTVPKELANLRYMLLLQVGDNNLE